MAKEKKPIDARRWLQRFTGKSERGRNRSLLLETQSFHALVRKFQSIRYLVGQKAVIDVIEKAPVGICITNEAYRYEYINPAYCRIYGYTFDELIGQSFTIVVPEEHRRELTSLHDEFMNREYELEGTWEVIRKDGSRLKILANAAYVIDEQGKPKKVTFVLDMTEKLDVVGRLDEMRRRADGLRSELLGLSDLAAESGAATVGERLRALATKMERDFT